MFKIFFYIIVLFSIACGHSLTKAEQIHNPISVVINTTSISPVVVKVKLKNISNKIIYIAYYNAPVENDPLKKLLNIKDKKGNELKYKGIRAKLLPATINKSFQLKSGESIEFSLNLTENYDFDQKNLGDLNARYEVINQVEGIDDDIKITSNWFKLSSE